jgi:hypothetical protein
MKEEEQRMNSPKLGRRQWCGGERAEEDPILQQCCREKRRRGRRRRERRTSSSVGAGVEQDDGDAPSLLFGPVRKRERQRSRGRRRHCGGKKSKFTPTPVFISKRPGSWGSWGVFHYPDRFRSKSPCGGTEWGGGYCNRATTQ